MNFVKVISKIFSFLYCSFYRPKQLFAILKMFQRSIFQRNAILLEIIQTKQKPSTIEFLLTLTNTFLDKNNSKTNESIPLK